MGKVDASQQRLAKIPVLLKRFRQSILAAACSGRLTADWREENVPEDAGTLIGRIRAKRPARFQDAAVRDDLELPDIPETWSWTNLRFLLSPAEAFCYGVVQPGANNLDGALLVRAGDLAAGRVDTSSLRRIPMVIHANYRRSQLLGGEILVTVVGAGIGKTAIAQPECAGFNIARALAKLPVREFNARYVHLWLQSGRAIDWMKGDSREVARPTLNLEQLQTLPVCQSRRSPSNRKSCGEWRDCLRWPTSLRCGWPRHAGKWTSSLPPSSPAPSAANSSLKIQMTNLRRFCSNGSE